MCNAGDIETPAQRIGWMLDNPASGREMGARARPWIAEHYDERLLKAKRMAWFEELVSRFRAGEYAQTLQPELLINIPHLMHAERAVRIAMDKPLARSHHV